MKYNSRFGNETDGDTGRKEAGFECKSYGCIGSILSCFCKRRWEFYFIIFFFLKLRFYCPVHLLWSYWAGQITYSHFSWAGLDLSYPELCAHNFLVIDNCPSCEECPWKIFHDHSFMDWLRYLCLNKHFSTWPLSKEKIIIINKRTAMNRTQTASVKHVTETADRANEINFCFLRGNDIDLNSHANLWFFLWRLWAKTLMWC